MIHLVGNECKEYSIKLDLASKLRLMDILNEYYYFDVPKEMEYLVSGDGNPDDYFKSYISFAQARIKLIQIAARCRVKLVQFIGRESIRMEIK